MQKEPELVAAASKITQQVRDLSFSAEAENVANDVLRGNA
jgi:hypothetical protein